MSLELKSLVQSIPDFDAWNHAKKIKFFAWYLHSQRGVERVSAADIGGFFDQLHIPKPSNITPFLAQMEKKNPKEAMKDSRGYYLAKSVRDAYESKYGQQTADPTPKTEKILPISLVHGAKRVYLERIIQQANGCYEKHWYDGCAVMMRRFIETMIIEVYEAHGKAAEIKDGNGNFIMLRDLLSKFLSEPSWNLQRDTQKVLPDIKALGDSSAHARRFTAVKDDVDKLLQNNRYRIAAEDLLHLANLI